MNMFKIVQFNFAYEAYEAAEEMSAFLEHDSRRSETDQCIASFLSYHPPPHSA